MKILFFDSGSYIYRDVLETLEKLGHEVHTVYYHFADRFEDDFFETRFSEKLSGYAWDTVFSINFYPLVAKSAKDTSIPYISWSYDSPLAERLLDYFDYETNRIYLFDRIEVEKLRALGHTNVFHMPLAANTDRLDKMVFSSSDRDRFSADISFVGQLYSTPILDHLMSAMDDYSKGYIEGVIAAQLEIYGADIVTPSVTEELLSAIRKAQGKRGAHTTLTNTGLVFAIQKQITFAERVTLINTLGEHFVTKFYSMDSFELQADVIKMGPVLYYEEMPAVFRYSKLNLCPTIRSIASGIPLRSIDIMASGGVLFSNYQIELAESFKDGEDCIMYSSLEEAIDKAAYYLGNPEILSSIAQNGHDVVKENFTVASRLRAMSF